MLTATRISVDDLYAAHVGKAVYVFAYYEWTIIWIIERLHCGFLSRYSHGKPMTSGDVQREFQCVINNHATDFSKISKPELQVCCDEFARLIIKRNALIHAHPCTDSDGSQILTYQTATTKPLPDMKWPRSDGRAASWGPRLEYILYAAIRPASTRPLYGIAGEVFFNSATSCRPKSTFVVFRSLVVAARTSANGCAPS